MSIISSVVVKLSLLLFLCRCDGGDGLQLGRNPGLSGQDEV